MSVETLIKYGKFFLTSYICSPPYLSHWRRPLGTCSASFADKHKWQTHGQKVSYTQFVAQMHKDIKFLSEYYDDDIATP